MRYPFFVLLILIFAGISAGCSGVKGNVGKMPTFPVPNMEAEWIRNGEPIEYEGHKWFPQDHFDILLDSEVYLLGEYRGVQFFVDKVDVKPYNRLYTKFSTNKFRSYRKENGKEKEQEDD